MASSGSSSISAATAGSPSPPRRDDVTDEDAFRALHRHGDGLAIVVRGEGRRGTAADYTLEDTDAVRDLIDRLTRHCEESV